jgi:VWFA-related protein
MNQRITLKFILLAAIILSGCKSFKESVRPIINPQAPPSYKAPIYMTGTKSIDEADPEKMVLEVWRVELGRLDTADNFPQSVNLYVRVFDSTGKLITNLAPPYYKGGDDYRKVWTGLTEQIGDDGKPQGIENFSVREFSDQDGIPYELALALDYSGTMGANIDVLEDAAAAFINLKRPQDRIAVVKFDRTPQLITRSTNSGSELLAAFNGQGLAGYGGYTALYSGAKMGAEQLSLAPSDHPRAVVLFTDGEDNSSTITASDLYKFCTNNNIPVFTVAFGPVNKEVLADISTYTGGKFYQTYTAEELKSAFEDIYRSLRNYYVVSYKPLYADGKHIAKLTITPPRSTRVLEATAEYNTLLRRVGGSDVIVDFAKPILFDYNKATIRPESASIIQAWADLMKSQSHLKIEVRGHTDAIGTDEYNQKLSEDRAAAVRDALIATGIDPKRIRSRGFGMSVPVAKNDTEEGRQKNRRTEFVVIQR